VQPLLISESFNDRAPSFWVSSTGRPSGRSVGAEICAHAGVAQLVEHRFCKPKVRGSSPLSSSSSVSDWVNDNLVGCPSGQREQAVNLPASAYEGSNPSPTTPALLTTAARKSSGVRYGSHVTRSKTAGVTQLVECQPSKLNVAGSNPVSRSPAAGRNTPALIAQSVERVLGKDEVTSSNLVEGSLTVLFTMVSPSYCLS
jgi:hypothetical protein